VTKGTSPSRRSSNQAQFLKRCITIGQPKGTIATGSGVERPASTHLLASAITNPAGARIGDDLLPEQRATNPFTS